jgi:hypothetical protein
MTGKDLTINAGLLPVMNFIRGLGFTTTRGRIMKHASQANIAELASIVHSLRGRGWKRVDRSEQPLQNMLC